MTTRHWMVPVLGAIVAVLAVAPATAEQLVRERGFARDLDNGEVSPASIPARINFIAGASGFQEVPAVLSPGRALLRARVNEAGDGIDYKLVYGDLQGAVSMAHIHIGQSGVNGTVAVALCRNEPADGGTSIPPCPGLSSGEVEGTLFEQDIVPGAAAQGVVNLQTLLAAMISRVTYLNVHTDRFPSGEVRGPIGQISLYDHSLNGAAGDGW